MLRGYLIDGFSEEGKEAQEEREIPGCNLDTKSCHWEGGGVESVEMRYSDLRAHIFYAGFYRKRSNREKSERYRE